MSSLYKLQVMAFKVTVTRSLSSIECTMQHNVNLIGSKENQVCGITMCLTHFVKYIDTI